MKSSGLKEGSRIFLNNFDKYMDILQSLDESKMSAPKGQVHEVDLPENPYLLDEEAQRQRLFDSPKSILTS